MFDGTLDTRKKYAVYFELKENYKQIFWRPYPVSKLHEEMLKNR